jgi:hypothetical protein
LRACNQQRILLVSTSADPFPGKDNPFQEIMSRSLSSAQCKEWSCEPLIAAREYPKTYVESACGACEEYFWAIEERGNALAIVDDGQHNVNFATLIILDHWEDF